MPRTSQNHQIQYLGIFSCRRRREGGKLSYVLNHVRFWLIQDSQNQPEELQAAKEANISMDFSISPQTDHRQPMVLPLLTDTTAPLFYKIIVPFSVVIDRKSVV